VDIKSYTARIAEHALLGWSEVRNSFAAFFHEWARLDAQYLKEETIKRKERKDAVMKKIRENQEHPTTFLDLLFFICGVLFLVLILVGCISLGIFLSKKDECLSKDVVLVGMSFAAIITFLLFVPCLQIAIIILLDLLELFFGRTARTTCTALFCLSPLLYYMYAIEIGDYTSEFCAFWRAYYDGCSYPFSYFVAV
jgi:hypothetical protein